MTDRHTLDPIVAELREALGDDRDHPAGLAQHFGLWLRPQHGGKPELNGRYVTFDGDAPTTRIRATITRLTARHLLRLRALAETDEVVDYIADKVLAELADLEHEPGCAPSQTQSAFERTT